MGGFVVRRVARGALTLVLLALLVHGGLALLPGDPIRALFAPLDPDPEIYQALRDQYHLDERWIVQFLIYLKDMFTGDWGHSFPTNIRGGALRGAPVMDIVKAAGPTSLRLIVPSVVVQLIAGAALGTIAAVYRGRIGGRAVYVAAVALLGIPVIALAYSLQTTFAWKLGWVTMTGLTGWPTYVLPVISMSLTTTCLLILFARSRMRDVLRQPFIKTATSLGIRKRRIVWIHAMKVSMASFITLIVANIGQLITSLIIVETIYSIPGLGHLLYTAIYDRDRALLLAMLVVSTGFVVVANMLADAAHFVLDPRTRTGDGQD
ncbi:MAG TPA: ABC transporter permease [Actinomycetota bacterium]|nr:ABC transporter permease [Actinomycetota bacterium]